MRTDLVLGPDARYSIIWYPDIFARVVVDWFEDTITIQQPQSKGGKRVIDMDNYTNFEGGMRDFVLHLRRIPAC